MIRTLSVAIALAGSLAAAAVPAAADVVVKVGPVYRPPAVVVRPAPVYVAPRVVVAPVVVGPTCRTVQQKNVVVKPNGTKVVSYQPVRVCK